VTANTIARAEVGSRTPGTRTTDQPEARNRTEYESRPSRIPPPRKRKATPAVTRGQHVTFRQREKSSRPTQARLGITASDIVSTRSTVDISRHLVDQGLVVLTD
jgi:hypothetical protein